MKIIEKETFLTPYTFLKKVKDLKFETWFNKVKKTVTKPELWNNSVLYTTLRQVKIFNAGDMFSTRNGRVLDASLGEAVVVSHSDRDLLSGTDCH